MSKRGADRQITKDDPEDGGEGEGMEEQGGTWKPASQETLATRQPIKARRKAISAPTGVAMPAFNFGGQMPTKAAEPTPDAAAASPAAAPAAASPPAAAEPNALQRLVAAQAAKGWACPTCEVRNPHTLTICAACQEPNPNPSAPATSAPAAAAAAAPAAAAPNALQLLAAKNKAQSWECDSCMTQNKTDATKCGACEAPRPGSSGTAAVASAAPTPAASGFSFGAQPAGDAVAAAAPATFSGGFSFGSDSASSFAPAAAAASSSSSSGGFSFGASEPSASAATFGAVPSFSFGGSAGSSLVSFGSVATGGAVGFGSAGASNGSAEGGEGGEGASPPQFEESSAETLSGAGAELASEFKNASKDPTGEEDDEVHLRMVSKVFQLKRLSKVQAPAADAHFDPSMPPAVQQPTELPIDSDQGELKYVEQGTGELHVNTVLDPVTKKTRARLVLREEKTKRSVLNAPLFVGMSHQLVGERQLRFQSLDLKGKMATFTLKFKQKSEAQEVDKEIEACLKRIQA